MTVSMKAITLTQPFASLIACGAKSVETRGYHLASVRPGEDLAIHAAAGWKLRDRQTCSEDPFASTLLQAYRQGHLTAVQMRDFPKNLPRGCVVAIARFVRCIAITPEYIQRLSPRERAFGFYRPGRYAWELEEVRPIVPVPATGHLYVWGWTPPSEIEVLPSLPVTSGNA